MPTPPEIKFLRQSEPSAVGFESTKDAGTASRSRNVRATDLFIRGVVNKATLDDIRNGRPGFEAVIGRSNFLPASFLEVGAATARATCLVRAAGIDFLGRSGAWSGTGFLIGPNLLLTNHHVLNSVNVATSATAVFEFQTAPDGRPLTPSVFNLRPERLFLTSPTDGGLDYSICWVDGEPGSRFGSVRARRAAFGIAVDEFANIVSHPAGRYKEVVLQENTVRWQDDLVVHYTSDTEPGSSGAAVCNNAWQLVALHHASKPADGGVVNEGIKLSAIAADLDRLASGGSATAREVLARFEGSDERLGFFGALGRPAPAGDGLEAVVNTFRGTENDIDVGFWNVEWLTKHYDTKSPAVARVIHELNLDVWSIEESSANAAKAVVAELKDAYGLEYGTLAAEPDSPDGKQSCTILWNSRTVSVVKEEWGERIESWLGAHSRDFADLGLGGFEAVHGKIFDRYPALFKVTSTAAGANGPALSFYLVPLHLKAMDEGSMRRKMASKILAEAVAKKAEAGGVADFVIGGDANAPLDSGDFANLTDAELVAASAEDAEGGAFSYIKGPRSLIDHVFVSPNLGSDVGNNFFIVAAERTFPDYVDEISDHRPVLLRLSLGAEPASPHGGGFESTGGVDPLAELKAKFANFEFAADGFERARRPVDLSNRTGYSSEFLGSDYEVPLPGLPDDGSDAVEVDSDENGIDRYRLDYTHYSVVLNSERKMAYFSAVNIDGRKSKRFSRGDAWFLDPRVPSDVQCGPAVYANNDLDRGHLTRRLDPVWGPDSIAHRADQDTFCFSNACPQHKDLNQREWARLEDYVLENAQTYDLKVSVFTGPVFGSDDIEYRGVLLPKEFWKVVVIRRQDTDRLSATAYILSQADMISGFEFAYGRYKTYQVKVGKVASLTGLDFGPLVAADPLTRGGFEAAGREAVEVTGPESLVL
jgi:DNA/RNA endonuclease G (NUC1)/V8-like Glu-specific endopeptidase